MLDQVVVRQLKRNLGLQPNSSLAVKNNSELNLSHIISTLIYKD